MTVLIVGAGPVGLVLACELARRDVDVRIIDRSRTPVAQSKAIIVWPRTLELLHGTGIAGEMVRSGHLLDGVRFHAEGAPLGDVDIARLTDSRYNHVLMLPQWETERILQERFTELGGQVEWGTELDEQTGVTVDADGTVHADLIHPDGRTERVTPTYLVGADGAHSVVRRSSGIDFEVHTPNLTFAIADLPITGTVDDRFLHYCYSGKGAIGLGPLGGGVFRCAVSMQDGQRPDRAFFQRAVDERVTATKQGMVATVGEPVWSARFDVRCATADRFRHGRTFLIGDAAHVVSPAGGQGLNTGIQDAVNLGWKLAGVLRGEWSPELLDSYHDERHEAVRRVSGVTDRQTRWGVLTDPRKVRVRDTLTRLAARTGVLQWFAAPLFSQTDVSYARWRLRDLVPRPRLEAGRRVPFVAERFSPDGTSLPTLVLPPGGESHPRLRAAVPQWQILRCTANAGADPAEARLGRMLARGGKALVVRPDGHVAAVVRGDDPAAVLGLTKAPQPPVSTDAAQRTTVGTSVR